MTDEDIEKEEQLKILHLKNLCDASACPFCKQELLEAAMAIKNNFEKFKNEN